MELESNELSRSVLKGMLLPMCSYGHECSLYFTGRGWAQCVMHSKSFEHAL